MSQKKLKAKEKEMDLRSLIERMEQGAGEKSKRLFRDRV